MTSARLQVIPARRAATMPPVAIASAHARRPPGSKTNELSEREHARLRCLRALAGTPRQVCSLLVELEGEDANLILAAGDQPLFIWRLALLAKSPPGCDDLRERAERTLDQVRLPRLASSATQIVVTQSGTALARSALVDALISRMAVPVRRAESLASA